MGRNKAMFDMARQQIRSKRTCLESQAKGVLSEQMVDLMYETLDKDKNGSVSKEEFLAGAHLKQLAARQMAQVGESMGEECTRTGSKSNSLVAIPVADAGRLLEAFSRRLQRGRAARFWRGYSDRPQHNCCFQDPRARRLHQQPRRAPAVVADPKCRMSPASRGSSKANADGAYTSTTSSSSFAAARAAAAFASKTLGEVIARLARAALKGTSTARCAPCSFMEEPARGHADRPKKCSGRLPVVEA